jgi:hypothetical protein
MEVTDNDEENENLENEKAPEGDLDDRITTGDGTSDNSETTDNLLALSREGKSYDDRILNPKFTTNRP